MSDLPSFQEGWAGPAGPRSGHVDDLTAAYVLGALEADERAEVDRHVLVCPACAGALADDRRAVGLLPFLAPPAVPPPTAKTTLFARIAQAQRSAAPARAAGRDRVPDPTPTLPASTPRLPVPSDRPGPRWALPSPARALPRGRGGALATLATVPLVLALTATGLWGMRLRDQVDTRNAQIDQLDALIRSLGVSEVAGDVGGAPIQMLSAGGGSDASGQIRVSPQGMAATIQLQVQQLTPSRAYDVYVNKNGTLVPSGTLQVDEAGQGVATIALDEPFANYESIAVEAKPLLADGTDIDAAPDTGGSVLSWEQTQPEARESIGDPASVGDPGSDLTGP